jgi:hypothetical protein
MKKIIFTLVLACFSFTISKTKIRDCSRNYEYEILELLDSNTLTNISEFFQQKYGICSVDVIKKNNELFFLITTSKDVDKNSIDLLTKTAFNKFSVKTKKCEHE